MKHPDVVSITIQTVNSAFDGETWRNEVAYILKGVAERILLEDDYLEGIARLHDTNGNRVGHVVAGNTPGNVMYSSREERLR